MHIKAKDVKPGVWLTVNNRYAKVVSLAEDQLSAAMKYDDREALVNMAMQDLRPIYLNSAIIEKCGFKKNGNIYSDAFFEITIGGGENIYTIMGRRLIKPRTNFLLSQLHLLQNIYQQQTGQALIFTPWSGPAK